MTRENKKLVDLLNAQNLCVSYGRVLLLETALANAVVENTKRFQGMFVPPFKKKGTFVFFAVHNTDFAEDTADGKCTTHGTITAVYQKADAPGEPISPPYTSLNLRILLWLLITLLYCHVTSPDTNPRTMRGGRSSLSTRQVWLVHIS